MKESADRPLQGSSAYGKMPLIRAKSIPFRFRLMAKTPLHFFAHPLPTATAALGCGGVPQKEVVAIMFMILGIGLFLSSPVIKCKKTPRKKCSFVAEEAKKR